MVKRRKRKGNAIEGQVTLATIVDAIAKQKRIDIDEELVELKGPILEHGSYSIPLGIFLPTGEKAVMTLSVVE